MLDEAQVQFFNASIRVAQYMSGAESSYQNAFLVVLLLTFLLNLFILIYFGILLRIRVITDLCEPLVLFILGYNSAPGNLYQDVRLGMRSEDFATSWVVKQKENELVVVGKEEAHFEQGLENKKWGFRMRSRKGFVEVSDQERESAS